MTKRYREVLDEVRLARADAPPVPDRDADPGADGTVDGPVAFRWRGQEYRVLQVLGHWREDPGWWRRPDGQPIRIEQTDLWRVEARNGVPTRGIYELVQRGDEWRLDRVWD